MRGVPTAAIAAIVAFLTLPLGPEARAHPRDYSVEVSALVQESPPQITLSWPADPAAEDYYVFRKAPSDTLWGPPRAVLDGAATSFTDAEVLIGQTYEYSFQKTLGFAADTVAIACGSEVTFVIRDSWGDGICCHHGLGHYEVTGPGGIVYAQGGDFGQVESTSFVVAGGPGSSEVCVAITLDIFGQETSWELIEDYSGQILASGGPYAAPHFGHILTGIRVPEVEARGMVLLLVEAEIAQFLGEELRRLELDLIGDGYRVRRLDVSGNEEVPEVKERIQTACAEDPSIETLFLLGHIAVPYSGDVRSAHANHHGAWPADLYYGELDGEWTDFIVHNTSASRPENHNVPGDGKFDQTFLPSDVDLQIGRVDLSRMPAFPLNDVGLLQRYLEKNHAWRTGQVDAEPRGLIDDNAGDAWGAAFAACGWRNFATMFGAERVSAGDFFPTLEHESYLWSYGCGPSGYTNCGGVGSTTDFATRTVLSPFTILYGSYFGDWDNENNVLRAPLGAQGYPLVCFWAGRPTWHLHWMSLGHPIGACTRLTQNNNTLYTVGDGGRQIHIALMGDPTLRMHVVKPPADLQVAQMGSGEVRLTWSPSNDAVEGYHIYRAGGLYEEFTRANASLVEDTTFVDTTAPPDVNVYMVRARKTEESASGTYANMSAGIIDSLTTAGVRTRSAGRLHLSITPNPSLGEAAIHFDLPRPAHVCLRVLDATGAVVRTVTDRNRSPGRHTWRWDGRDGEDRRVPAGVYFVRMQTLGQELTRPLIRLQ